MNRKSRFLGFSPFSKGKKVVSPSSFSNISSLLADEGDEEYKKLNEKWLVTNIEDRLIKGSKYKNYEYSAFTAPGSRWKDEDLIIIHEDLGFYAVCDGHRSKDAAEICLENIPRILETNIETHLSQTKTTDPYKFVNSHDDAAFILRLTFIEVHEVAREQLERESGCTIACVWFYRLINSPKDIYMVAANAGDARCVIGRTPKSLVGHSSSPDIHHKLSVFNSIRHSFSKRKKKEGSVLSEIGRTPKIKTGKSKRKTFWERTEKFKLPKIIAERLSYDHKATDISEINRVDKAGGIIFGGKLECMLQVTRGIGDHDFEPGFSPEPFIASSIKVDKEIKFVILSSDGIFDVVTDEEAVNCVDKEITQRGLKKASLKLGNLALKKKAIDDLSCIIISLMN